MDNNQLYELLVSKCGDEEMPSSLRREIEWLRDAKPNGSARKTRLLNHLITANSAVLEFVRAIIVKTENKGLYLPFASSVEVEELRSDALTVSYSTPNYELSDLIQKKTGIPPSSEDSASDLEYDVVYSILPLWDDRKESIPRKIVEESIGSLAQNGIGIFTFINRMVITNYAKRWHEELSAKGIYVSAIIDLPEGLYEPIYSFGTKIVVFSKEKIKKLFLAKIEVESDAPKIANFYLSQSNGPKPELGIWVERDAFLDFESYENEQIRKRTAVKLRKAYNGEMTPISAISTAVNVLRSATSSFDEAENAVYVPRFGSSKVVSRLSELREESQNQLSYFQILVDEKQVLPEFLKFFLNSDEGVAMRIHATGRLTFVTPLIYESLMALEVPVPSLKTQTEVLATLANLNKLENEVSRLKSRLEVAPASYSNIAKDMKDINNTGDRFEQWIESLPYPLATILKQYAVSDSNQERQEKLFHFFEAYSIFSAAILTAIYRRPQFNHKEIKNVDVDYFEKASFGAWVRLDRELAELFRKQINDPETIDTTLKGFQTEDRVLVNLISNKDVCSILQRTCEKRNKWKGHSGITSEEIYADHVRELGLDLSNLQKQLKDLYERIRLIRPIRLNCRRGEFINTVEPLTGSNPHFKKDEVVGEALDEDKLYFQVIDTGKTFEAPPFFVLKRSPIEVKNACFFFSRVEGDESLYVSYHFPNIPEYFEMGQPAFDTLKSILGN
ncbi:MAG: hypothetical protein IJM30_01760 [Thermoguttaceae bacterium]|nr:hypothetical protein [Thermoguttaceae bacterium]